MAKVKHQTPPGFERVVAQGGKRVTYKPKHGARATHGRFLSQVVDHPLSFVDPGIQVAEHVRKEHRYFFSTDLTSAFDQVTAERLREALRYCHISPRWLSPRNYFFHEDGHGGLIQGAPSSPYLFETYCRFGGLDWALLEYCDRLGFHYSRYVDDILISSARPLGKRIGPSVRALVGKYGFALSDSKTKRVDVNSQPLTVLGYTINGSRIDESAEVINKLFEPDRSERSRTGLFRWRRHVRGLRKLTKR